VAEWTLGRVPARGVLHRACVECHLVNRNEMPISGSDSYTLLFLCITALFVIVAYSLLLVL